MGKALIAANNDATITARLNTDGVTPTAITADPSSHAMSVSDGNTGSDNGGTGAAFDENQRPTMFAVSSSDGTTLVALYSDSTGHLLIQST